MYPTLLPAWNEGGAPVSHANNNRPLSFAKMGPVSSLILTTEVLERWEVD